MAEKPKPEGEDETVHRNHRQNGKADAARALAFLAPINEQYPELFKEPQFVAVILNNYVAAVLAKGDTVNHS